MTGGGDAAEDPLREYFGTVPAPYSFEQWLARIQDVLASDRRRYLSGHHNLHSLYMLHRDAQMQKFYRRCDDWYIDGVPVRLVLAGFGVSTSADQRFTLMDHFEAFLDHAANSGWRIFYLGSAPEVVERARTMFASSFPSLQIAMQHGYFGDNDSVVGQVNEFRPDILLVGMGVPRQEHWIIDNLESVDAAFITHCGGSMDYLVGVQARPPAWVSRIGLGGLYRLLHNPGRLWRRYLVEPWGLLPVTFRQCWRQRGRQRGVKR